MTEEQDLAENGPAKNGTALEIGEKTHLEPGALATQARYQLGLSRAEMIWAAVAHGSVLLTVLLGVSTAGIGALVGVAIPATIWAVNRGKSEYVADQARQAAMFQLLGMALLLALAIVGTLLLVIGWVVTGLLTVVLVGLILIPVMIVVTVAFVLALILLPIAQAVYGCYAAAEAYNGRPFRYRWIADAMDQGFAQSES